MAKKFVEGLKKLKRRYLKGFNDRENQIIAAAVNLVLEELNEQGITLNADRGVAQRTFEENAADTIEEIDSVAKRLK